MVNVASIFSTLGNPNSLIPLAVKDLSATAGMTAASFVTGKEEGQDRFIDEIGTEAIWLLGLPGSKWVYDKTVFKAMNLDAKFDARNLKDKKIFEKIKQYAPTKEIKQSLEKIGKNEKTFKYVTFSKFLVATALTVGSYIGLTHFKQKYTENKIRQNLIAEYEQKKLQESKKEKESTSKNLSAPSFKGLGSVVEGFVFNPVKNMWILDGAITGERLKDSRSPQEFIGYGIKEAATLTFMYYAGDKIKEILEEKADKNYKKSIGLDARVIEDGFIKKAFEDGSIQKSLDEFKALNESEIYDFLHKKPDNLVVKTAKMSDVIEMYKEPQGLFKKSKVTDKIDVRKYIKLDDVKDINNKLETLYTQYKDALAKGETSDEFFNSVKKLKRSSIIKSMGICIFALAIATPAIMLAKRLTTKNDQEFQTKKEIRKQLIKEGVIA